MAEYVCFKRRPKRIQITWEDLWDDDGRDFTNFDESSHNELSATVTYKDLDYYKLSRSTNVLQLIRLLHVFNEKYADLHNTDEHELFTTFFMAKKDKGMKAVFDAIFKSQNRYVPCNSGEVCSSVARLLQPIIQEHSEVTHKTVYEETKKNILEYLGANGFATDVIDLDEIISSAFRKISAPVPKLYNALNELKSLFEKEFCGNTGPNEAELPERSLHHTAAFAYVKHRSTVDAIKKHQQNTSKWFGKFDLKNFFGSTTLDYTMRMMGMVFPFSRVVHASNYVMHARCDGDEELRKALSLAFLDGGLPQGTPISPLITNIIMIPVDYELSKMFRKWENETFVYTRYADDFLVSNRKHFDVKAVESAIIQVLRSFSAPFTIKAEKTRYGSSAGRNWNLGLMLNKDNKITVGHEKKRIFRAQLSSYVMDKRNGINWSLSEVQVMDGIRSYYTMVEADSINAIIQKINTKFGVDSLAMIREDLRSLAC